MHKSIKKTKFLLGCCCFCCCNKNYLLKEKKRKKNIILFPSLSNANVSEDYCACMYECIHVTLKQNKKRIGMAPNYG